MVCVPELHFYLVPLRQPCAMNALAELPQHGEPAGVHTVRQHMATAAACIPACSPAAQSAQDRLCTRPDAEEWLQLERQKLLDPCALAQV